MTSWLPRLCRSLWLFRSPKVRTGAGPSNSFDDAWELPLSGDMVWSLMQPQGTPPVQMGSRAAYDPVRDRIVVLAEGERSPLAFSLGAAPVWTRLYPEAAAIRSASTWVYDPARDRFLASSSLTTMALEFGRPLVPEAFMPERITWMAGSALDVNLTVINPYPFDQPAIWRLDSQRLWRGFPFLGNVVVPAGDMAVVHVAVPVPDSAAAGANVITARVTFGSVPQSVACTTSVMDDATPVLIALVRVETEPGRVRLLWRTHATMGSAIVQRRSQSSAWTDIGTARPVDGEMVEFEDQSVVPGRRYGYRLLVDSVPVGETWATVPAGWTFRLGEIKPNPTLGRVRIEFTLAARDPVTIEVLDLAGRRRGITEFAAPTPGKHSTDVSVLTQAPAGLYFIRLTQRSERRTAKVAVVR